MEVAGNINPAVKEEEDDDDGHQLQRQEEERGECDCTEGWGNVNCVKATFWGAQASFLLISLSFTVPLTLVQGWPTLVLESRRVCWLLLLLSS